MMPLLGSRKETETYHRGNTGVNAFILAGGFGTRLRPITYQCPKPMVPVRGKPFLQYVLDLLRKQGILDIVLCLHYKAERFIEYFGCGDGFGVRISYSIEKEPLGTAGAIKNAQKHTEETFLVLNGDTYVEIDLIAMLEYHKERDALATIALARTSDCSRYGSAEISGNGHVLGFSEKSSSSRAYVNAGVYVFEPEVLNYIPEKVKCSLESDVFPNLLEGRLYGYLTSSYFVDIGTPEDYRRFERSLAEEALRP